MADNNRIYLVSTTSPIEGESDRMVMATNPAQAMRHVAKSRYSIKPATAIDVARRMIAGALVEDASAQANDEPDLAEPVSVNPLYAEVD
jgi:hypothetical protein